MSKEELDLKKWGSATVGIHSTKNLAPLLKLFFLAA
jgi:hypothetical protein